MLRKATTRGCFLERKTIDEEGEDHAGLRVAVTGPAQENGMVLVALITVESDGLVGESAAQFLRFSSSSSRTSNHLYCRHHRRNHKSSPL